ncbi:BLOC-1 related complex subunit 6 [Pungitius pungitius]|uniref:BLOC-1 related complex subunit 6 n=1 Tax=Pungitius pungitius TaxID=134920 RepID=UPI002E14300B
MSLSPVGGTVVPEAANGVLTPVSSEKGPHVPISVKFAGSREPCPGEEDTENHVDAENRVYDGESHLGTEKYNNGRTSTSFTQHTPHVTDASLPAASRTGSTDICEACDNVEPPDAAPLWDPAQQAHCKESSQRGGLAATGRQQNETDSSDRDNDSREKQDEEEDEKNEKKWINQRAGGRTKAESSRHYSSSAPGPSTSSTSTPPPPLLPSDDIPCPPHVMAQVWVRNVRGMQDSKSLDEISQACGGGSGPRVGGRGGQSEGRRATISSALELEGTVSQDGDLTHFITKNLEQKIKMSSKPSLDCSDSDCSGPIYRSRGLSRRPADIPPIDPAVLLDLQRHTQDVAHSVEMMMRSLNGTIQNMTALSVGYIQTYRDSVDSLGESVDMSIKGMYTLMARCEELDRSMQPIHTLSAQIRDIKRTLDALEAICK